ncbi:MAG: nucleoside triphosphate diphosphatase [Thermoleophilaceae bacterium]|nr:nucleoside triphosphate diphosphatase [Thermoleophilaceae bacterium]
MAAAPREAPASEASAAAAEALRRLDEVTRHLRVECPWDREQDERSIVPHTVEEAYELADAAQRGDDGKLLDELGDVLFQVHFLALLLEERGAGGLADVADHCRTKLIRRHPHVFGEVEVEGAAEVLRNWDQIKQGEEGREPGIFGDVPETLPATLYARKLLRRAGGAGREWPDEGARERLRATVEGALAAAEAASPSPAPGSEAASPGPAPAAASAAAAREPGAIMDGARDERFDAVGELLLAAVALARELRVDPELSLRAAADRMKTEIEGGR